MHNWCTADALMMVKGSPDGAERYYSSSRAAMCWFVNVLTFDSCKKTRKMRQLADSGWNWRNVQPLQSPSVSDRGRDSTTGQVSTMLLFWQLPLWLWLSINGWSWMSHEILEIQIELSTSDLLTPCQQSVIVLQMLSLFFQNYLIHLQILCITATWLPSASTPKSCDLVFWSWRTCASGSGLLTHHKVLCSIVLNIILSVLFWVLNNTIPFWYFIPHNL